jgi:hypothetical protein
MVKFYEKHGTAREKYTVIDKSYTKKGLEAAKKHCVDVDAKSAERREIEREAALTSRQLL